MMALCTTVFVLFTFCFLYFYQDDILAVGQHVLSGGKTHYDRTIGAVLITATLWLLQAAVYSFSRLRKHGYWLTFFPSLLILTILTDISSDIGHGFSWGAWPWVIPVLLIVYGLLLWVARQFQPYEAETNGNTILSRVLWVNLLAMFLMLFCVGLVSNHNDVFHYRARMERLMQEGKYGKALQTGRNAMATDSSLTMLRVYALSKEGLLGDHLFEYPLVGGSSAMVPNGESVQTLLLSPKAVRDQSLRQRSRADYLLCGLLLDRKLDRFAQTLPRCYRLDNRLPKHYREALYLYTHIRSHPSVVLHDNVMDADFSGYQDIIHNTPDKTVRKNLLHDSYGKTYWFYYQYE